MTDSSPLQSSDGSIEILLVEDNPGDVRLIEEGFAEIATETTFHTVSDGYDAIGFLKQHGAAEAPSLPDLALVDLNLPGKDGCEVLEVIRADPQLEYLPVIMLTSSNDNDDVTRCYSARANAYITKPTDAGGYISMAKAIEQFWFGCVQLPSVPH